MYIRPATKDDIPIMAELLRQLFVIESDFTADIALQSRGLDLLLDKQSAVIFVAEHQKEVVGMCTVQTLVSTAKGCEVGQVEDVVVDISHRGMGIGSTLLHTVEAWAKKCGLARLQLQADRYNHSALGFYRCQGWHSTNLKGWMKHL